MEKEAGYSPSYAEQQRWQTLKQAQHVDVFGAHDVLATTEKRPNPLEGYIQHFDLHWRREGLPADWYNLKKKVGFSMNGQMNLLQGDNFLSLVTWVKQTEQDMLGFCLEYLSNGLIYPFRYKEKNGRLFDDKYGKEMLEMVSPKERNGSVIQSLTKIQEFMVDKDTLEDSFAVMPSPLGESGLTTDNGAPILYPDSYWFVFVKHGGDVRGFTVKTDFSLLECREAIYHLTGNLLPLSAPLEQYVSAIAMVKSNGDTNSWEVKQHILEIIKKSRDSEFAYQNQTWDEILQDVKREDTLCSFTNQTRTMINDFREYALSKNHSKHDLKNALAATILRLSKTFLFDEEEKHAISDEDSIIPQYFAQSRVTFGQVLDEVETRPGCAGGGARITVNSIVPRAGEIGKSGKFTCPNCEKTADGPVGDKCPHCGYTKEQFIKDHPELACA